MKISVNPYGDQDGTCKTATEASGLRSKLDGLGKTISELRDLVDHHAEILAPVLRPTLREAPVESGGCVSTDEPVICSLSEVVVSYTRDLQVLADTLGRITSGVDL